MYNKMNQFIHHSLLTEHTLHDVHLFHDLQMYDAEVDTDEVRSVKYQKLQI